MAEKHEKKEVGFGPAGHLVLRTPLLPFSALEPLANPDRRAARQALNDLLVHPVVGEAISLAAPGLAGDIPLWQKQPESERGEKIERALMKYVQRLAARCTPFGLFAGVTLGQVGRQQTLVLSGRETYRRRSRLDMGVLYALCEKLLERRAVRQQCRLRPNDTLLRVGEQFHFVKARQADETRHYELAQAEISEPLTAALTYAVAGKTGREIIEHVQKSDAALSQTEVTDFVDQLIDEQLLQSDLAPLITGDEAAIELAAKLKTMNEVDDVRQALMLINDHLASVDRAPLGHAPAIDPVELALKPFELTSKAGQLVQSDLYKPAQEVALSQALGASLLRAAKLLTAVFRPTDMLAKTREAFSARYEGAEVPLLEALDDEVGVGFAEKGVGEGPLLKDVVLGGGGRQSLEFAPQVERWLVDVMSRAREGKAVISESELEALGQAPALPESFAFMIQLLGDGGEHSGPKALFEGVTGPSSENLNGRFCWLDRSLAERVSEALAAEEALRPEVIFADIVHSPEGRVGNVIARPSLRAREIPLLARAGTADAKHIALRDLLLSLVDGRFVLRLKQTGQEVVPRLTNAHNVAGGLPLYRFLAMIQGEGTRAGMIWNWGTLAATASLPRVSLGDLVLCEAQWRLGKTTLSGLKTEQDFQALAKKWGWPRFLRCHEGDNTLPIDCHSALSVATFINTYRKRPSVALSEDLQRTLGSPVSGPEGHFANEVVISYRAKERLVPPLAARPAGEVKRVFYPGDECLYVRIYAEPASVDQLLTLIIAPVIAWAKASGHLERWFFIRYDDKGHHLRLRCFGRPAWLLGELLPRLREELSLAESLGYVGRLELGTYTREIERYGGAASMAICEAWFQADSDAVLALLERSDDLDLRWQWCLVAMNDALSALALDNSQKLACLTQWRASLMGEFGNDDGTEDSLAKKFRTERTKVASLLEREAESLMAVKDILDTRLAKLSELAKPLPAFATDGKLHGSLTNLANSLLHMDTNRLLRNGQRAQEFVLYDFLSRALRSQVARRNH